MPGFWQGLFLKLRGGVPAAIKGGLRLPGRRKAMNLGEAKAKALKLMDEYSSRGARVNDPDLEAKLPALFDIAQKQLAQIKKIVRRYKVPVAAGVTDYPMPEDYAGLRRLWVDGKPGAAGTWFGDVLVLDAQESRTIMVEYNACPADIPDDAPDSYEFEIARDAQECMPYWVAAQPFIADNFVVNYQDLMGIYDRMAAALDTRIPGSAAAVKMGWL